MAYIDKIQVGGKTYDIKDNSSGGPYLPLAGGTMDSGAQIIIPGTGTTLSTTITSGQISFDSSSSIIEAYADNGTHFLSLQAGINWLILGDDSSVDITNPSEWRSALGLGSLATVSKNISDSTSSSNGALSSSSTNLVTERDVYYGLPTINGAHTYTSGTSIYAPTATGTAGQTLISNKSGAPVWRGFPYNVCETTGAAKATSGIANWKLHVGNYVYIVFLSDDNISTTSNFTLNVNGTGAKPIYYNGVQLTSDIFKFKAGVMYHFVYAARPNTDGCYHLMSFSAWPEEVVSQADTPTNPHTQIWIDTDA